MAGKRSYRSRKRITKKRVVGIVKRVVNSNVEKKFWNIDLYTAQAAATTWSFQSACAGLVQGTTASTRLGNKVKLHRIDFLIAVLPAVGAAMANGTRCRLILYHNRAANGALPTATALFDTNDCISLRNETQRTKFTIMREYVHNMSALTITSADVLASAGPPAQFIWSIYPKHTLTYTANTGTSTDLLTHDYGFGFVADDTCCAVTCKTKMVFTDA